MRLRQVLKVSFRFATLPIPLASTSQDQLKEAGAEEAEDEGERRRKLKKSGPASKSCGMVRENVDKGSREM